MVENVPKRKQQFASMYSPKVHHIHPIFALVFLGLSSGFSPGAVAGIEASLIFSKLSCRRAVSSHEI